MDAKRGCALSPGSTKCSTCRIFIDYKTSMITDSDRTPCRGCCSTRISVSLTHFTLFDFDLGCSHTLHVLEEKRRRCEHLHLCCCFVAPQSVPPDMGSQLKKGEALLITRPNRTVYCCTDFTPGWTKRSTCRGLVVQHRSIASKREWGGPRVNARSTDGFVLQSQLANRRSNRVG